MQKINLFVACIVLVIGFVFVLQPPAASASSLITDIEHWAVKHTDINPCVTPELETDFYQSHRRMARLLPTLGEFIASVDQADATTVIGVYVCQVLALRIAQQPTNDPTYVSAELGTATQFRLAANYGTVGLLAHNDRSGERFLHLKIGHEVDVIRGDRSIHRYVVSRIRRLQPLRPDDPYSDFNDLDNGGDRLSSTQVFQQFFTGGDQVVFQTCISANGNFNWGRLFIIATPLLTN